MRIMMVIASGLSYLVSNSLSRGRYAGGAKFNFESPLTQLVWLTSLVSVALTYLLSYVFVPNLGGNPDLWWQLSTVITCGTLAGAIIPELVKVFTSTESRHVREVVTSSREGGASLNILSGFVAGNFSAYWLGHHHHGPHGHRLRGEHAGAGRADEGAGDLRLRAGRLRLPGHGPGDDRRGQLRPSDRQCPVHLRALPDRAGARA